MYIKTVSLLNRFSRFLEVLCIGSSFGLKFGQERPLTQALTDFWPVKPLLSMLFFLKKIDGISVLLKMTSTISVSRNTGHMFRCYECMR